MGTPWRTGTKCCMEASCTFELAVRCLYADLTALPSTVNLEDRPARRRARSRARHVSSISPAWSSEPKPVSSLAVQRVNWKPCPSRALWRTSNADPPSTVEYRLGWCQIGSAFSLEALNATVYRNLTHSRQRPEGALW
jgi:hypothetical protein